MSVPVIAIFLLAALCVSPWVTKVTVGPVSAELSPASGLAALVRDAGGDLTADLDPTVTGQARAAEYFWRGARLPDPWAECTLLFLLPPPDPAVVAHTVGTSGQPLTDDQLDALTEQLSGVINTAADAPGEIVEAGEAGRSDLAYAALNAGKRVVALVVATVPAKTVSDTPDEAATAVRGAMLAVGRGWARVVIDLLGVDDDTP